MTLRVVTLRHRAIRLVPHPPIPGKLVYVAMLAGHDKADRNHEDLAVTMGFFCASWAVAIGLARLALPSPFRLYDFAAWAL
ncbi:hypothetical protein D3C80_1977920 [compost metagenome]